MICRKCGGNMKNGLALQERYEISPDFYNDTPETMTIGTASPSGEADLIQVLKCEKCGHSVSGKLEFPNLDKLRAEVGEKLFEQKRPFKSISVDFFGNTLHSLWSLVETSFNKIPLKEIRIVTVCNTDYGTDIQLKAKIPYTDNEWEEELRQAELKKKLDEVELREKRRKMYEKLKKEFEK